MTFELSETYTGQKTVEMYNDDNCMLILNLDTNSFDEDYVEGFSEDELNEYYGEMIDFYDEHKRDLLEYEKDAYQYNGVNREDFI